MTDKTPLDLAHAAMEAAPEDEAARLGFYQRLSDSELFLLLSAEARGQNIEPEVFELSDNAFVLAFDREARLAQFAGREVPYAAISGRALSEMLAPNGLGLGVNLDVAPSAILIPPDAVAWLAERLEIRPRSHDAQLREVFAPGGLPEALLTQLDTKLAIAVGMAPFAYLVGVVFDTGARGHMLGFIDAIPGSQDALARAVSEALAFSGLEAAALDVGFFAGTDAMAARLARHGLRFDLPQPRTSAAQDRPAPGSDPDKPPILT